MINLSYPIRLISKDNEKIQNKYGRYFLSAKYKRFEKTIKDLTFLQYKDVPLSCNLKVEIYAHYKNKVHPDTQNLPKSICDSLQNVCYVNDRQIKKISVEVFENSAEDRFLVIIEEI